MAIQDNPELDKKPGGRLLNPFIYGKVVEGDRFLDRESEVAAVSQTLLSGQNIICYSPRRYGKTSMIIRVKELLSARSQMVFFIDLFRITSLEDLYNLYATSIAAAVRTPIKALLATIQSILPTVNPKLVFRSPDSTSIEVSVPVPVLSKSATLRELFDSLEAYCARKRKKGTVIFDEFQEIAAIQDGSLIEREMRSAFQHHKHVAYAFLGSKQHLLREIFRNKNRPFYNFGRHFELDVIDSEHWREYIRVRMGSACPADCIDEIIRTTENHPYYTQMYCHYLWDYAKQHKGMLHSAALHEVAEDMLQRDSLLFSELWDATSSKERRLLRAMAAGNTMGLYDKQFIVNHGFGSASTVQKAAAKLVRLDYIRKRSSGEMAFVNPFFRLWVDKASSASFSLPEA